MLQAELPPMGIGGVGRQVDLLATELVRRDHDVTAFVIDEPPASAPYRCVHVRLRRDGRLRRQAGVGLAFARLDLDDFDVVHAHGDDWLLGRRPRVRTFYGTALMEARSATSFLRGASQVFHYGFEWLSSLSAHGVTISVATRRHLPLARQCIPCAFDPSVFFPGTERTTEPSILFVAGALGGRKRGQLLLDAFAEVRGAIPEARLTIVSRDQVSRPGITCYSGVDAAKLGRLYRTHWLLCSASSYEGFGVPYIEALASGLPVVTTANLGAEEVLGREGLGVICSPQELATSLVELLGDRRSREELSSAGIEASARYSITAVADSYEGVYQEVLDKSQRPR